MSNTQDSVWLGCAHTYMVQGKDSGWMDANQMGPLCDFTNIVNPAHSTSKPLENSDNPEKLNFKVPFKQ